MKAYQITISGSYRNRAEKKVIDFGNVTGIVPYNSDEVVKACIIRRYAGMWLMNNKDYPESLHSVRNVYIDEMKKLKDHDFSFVGKDIKKMTYEELQDLACAKDLRGVPLYKKIDLRQSQIQAYCAYSANILNEPIDRHSPKFDFMKLPSIIVDEKLRTDNSKTISNEEVIDGEVNTAKGEPIKTNLSREELIEIAQTRGVTFHPTISTDNLYKKCFNVK